MIHVLPFDYAIKIEVGIEKNPPMCSRYLKETTVGGSLTARCFLLCFLGSKNGFLKIENRKARCIAAGLFVAFKKIYLEAASKPASPDSASFQSISLRSFSPTVSRGCFASMARLELKKVRPFLFSAIHLPAKVPS